MSDCYQVLTAIDSEAAAARIADLVVTERLAACAQVSGPISSVYRWQNGVERASEWLCTAKTTATALPALLQRIRALHSYEQPEIIATAIAAGDAGYLDWIRRETNSASKER